MSKGWEIPSWVVAGGGMVHVGECGICDAGRAAMEVLVDPPPPLRHHGCREEKYDLNMTAPHQVRKSTAYHSTKHRLPGAQINTTSLNQAGGSKKSEIFEKRLAKNSCLGRRLSRLPRVDDDQVWLNIKQQGLKSHRF